MWASGRNPWLIWANSLITWRIILQIVTGQNIPGEIWSPFFVAYLVWMGHNYSLPRDHQSISWYMAHWFLDGLPINSMVIFHGNVSHDQIRYSFLRIISYDYTLQTLQWPGKISVANRSGSAAAAPPPNLLLRIRLYQRPSLHPWSPREWNHQQLNDVEWLMVIVYSAIQYTHLVSEKELEGCLAVVTITIYYHSLLINRVNWYGVDMKYQGEFQDPLERRYVENHMLGHNFWWYSPPICLKQNRP